MKISFIISPFFRKNNTWIIKTQPKKRDKQKTGGCIAKKAGSRAMLVEKLGHEAYYCGKRNRNGPVHSRLGQGAGVWTFFAKDWNHIGRHPFGVIKITRYAAKKKIENLRILLYNYYVIELILTDRAMACGRGNEV